ncbi:MAG: DMT family transporter [bacterium]
MNWFLLALLAPLAWSVANYLDKFLLSNSQGEGEGGSGGLLILSSLVSLIAAGCIFLKQGALGITLDSQSVGVLILSGMFEALYILFYFWALEAESTATVISLFQFAPIMGLLFGYLMLSESPTGMQFLAVLVILVGTLLIIKKKGERLSFNGHVLLLMIVATTFVGIYNTLFKIVGEHIPFWTAMFWQYLGIGMVGFLLFFGVAPYRKQAIDMLTKKSLNSLGLTGLAEVMNIVALMATNAAILLAPVALVLSISSIQPVFVLIEAYIITVFFPKFLDPCDKPVFMLQYVLGILLVCVGGFLIY